MTATASQIDLWCAFPREITDAGLIARYHGLMNPEERAKQARFYFEKDRHRYLVTRALVRTVLSRYAPIAPEAWTFITNEYGRPEVASGHVPAQGISFNITHTDGLIIVGVVRGYVLGIDTENVTERKAPIEVADRYFAPDETAALRALPESMHPQRFFELWTLKESYIKARGMGLSIPLDHFSFSFPEGDGIELSIDPRQQDSPSRWRFWQLRPTADFLAAVCAERVNGTAPPRLCVKKVVPFASEQEMDCAVLRISAA